jgi:acyl-CoA hydrolase
VGSVIKIGNTSIKINVDIYIEEMYSDKREKAITGEFTLVAIDENKRPTPINH